MPGLGLDSSFRPIISDPRWSFFRQFATCNPTGSPPVRSREIHMSDESIPREEWATRCARRIVEVDDAIPAGEARRIALDMRQVERLAAMRPEDAVAFVQRQLASERPDRYERRLNTR